MSEIIAWFQANWIAVIAVLWTLEELIALISKLTPWEWDDRIGSILGNLLAKFFPKQ